MAVVAPSGPFEVAAFERGVAVLSERYRVVLGTHLFESRRYLAGDDAARRADLVWALESPSVRAVFAARGGYGMARLLGSLPPLPLKALVGFSDLTAVHLVAQSRQIRSLHGPVLTQLGSQPPSVVARLFDALEGRSLEPLEGSRTVVPGSAEGPLIGGNFVMLASLVGTPFFPSLDGAVLLLEEVGERPYRIDRLWTQLSLAGVLEGVAGVVLGDFTGCEERDASYTSAEVLDELAQSLGVPCAAGFPIGHGAVNQPVPLGARVRLSANERRLTFLEGLTA